MDSTRHEDLRGMVMEVMRNGHTNLGYDYRRTPLSIEGMASAHSEEGLILAWAVLHLPPTVSTEPLTTVSFLSPDDSRTPSDDTLLQFVCRATIPNAPARITDLAATLPGEEERLAKNAAQRCERAKPPKPIACFVLQLLGNSTSGTQTKPGAATLYSHWLPSPETVLAGMQQVARAI